MTALATNAHIACMSHMDIDIQGDDESYDHIQGDESYVHIQGEERSRSNLPLTVISQMLQFCAR